MWFWFSIAIYACAAFFSVGFAHPDEHFQIIEYMAVFSGKAAPSSLTYEFALHMRPWFWPLFCFFFLRPFTWIGISSPFTQVFLLRLLSALLFLLQTFVWWKAFSWKKNSRMNLFLLTGLWFLPYWAVRVSSDSISASLLLLALGLVYREDIVSRNKNKHFSTWIIAWFCFLGGIACLIRYQAFIPLVLASAWMLWKGRWGWARTICCMFGVIIILFLDPVFNFLACGEWYISWYNHFNQNIFGGVASSFGTLPWWGYFKMLFTRGLVPLNLVLVAAFINEFIRRPLSFFSIISMPVFLCYSLIGHKELRFLMPLFFLSPIVLVCALEDWRDLIKNRAVKVLAIFLLLLNGLAFMAGVFTPAHRPILIYKAISEVLSAGGDVHVYYDDFDPSAGRHLEFDLSYYKNQKVWNVIAVENPVKISERVSSGELLLVTSKLEEYKATLDIPSCRVLKSAYPLFLLKHNLFGWADRSSVWILWKCAI